MRDFCIAKAAPVKVFDHPDDFDGCLHIRPVAYPEMRSNRTASFEVSSCESFVYDHGSPRWSLFRPGRTNIASIEIAARNHRNPECRKEAWPNTHVQHIPIADKAMIR